MILSTQFQLNMITAEKKKQFHKNSNTNQFKREEPNINNRVIPILQWNTEK